MLLSEKSLLWKIHLLWPILGLESVSCICGACQPEEAPWEEMIITEQSRVCCC